MQLFWKILLPSLLHSIVFSDDLFDTCLEISLIDQTDLSIISVVSTWRASLTVTMLYPVVWMAWNSYPNCGHKNKSYRSIHIHKLIFVASNDRFRVTWHSWGEKMFKSTKFTPTELRSVGAPQHHWLYLSQRGLTSISAC